MQIVLHKSKHYINILIYTYSGVKYQINRKPNLGRNFLNSQ